MRSGTVLALPIAVLTMACSETHSNPGNVVDGAAGAGGEQPSTESTNSGGTATDGATSTRSGGASATGGVDATSTSGEAGATGNEDSGGDASTETGSSSGGASATGTGGSSAATGGNGGIGGTGTGGSGGDDPVSPSTVGSVGERCSPNGALACAGYAQKGQLACVSGQWESSGTCSGNNNCDTTPGASAGSCQPIVPECIGKTPGDPECRDKERFDCGPDLVTRDNVDVCEGGCVDGACTECQLGTTRVCGFCDLGTQSCVSGSWSSCQDPRPSCATDLVCGNNESCCTAELVSGGSYRRGSDDTQPDDATVSDFCLDKYEVTVGRFREFVEDYDNFELSTNDGEHQPGAGTGWLGEWDKGDELAANETALRTALTDCSGSSYGTWRDSAGTASAERLPINCINWFTAFAFCIWDGGRLATDAEWEYAAGGANDWMYPWGNTSPDDGVHAVYGDCGGSGSCSTRAYSDIIAVGSRPGGAGYWDHLDMAGSMAEWVFDWYSSDFVSTSPCNDCANLEPETLYGYDMRVLRGGSWASSAGSSRSTTQTLSSPELSGYESGIRCVRLQ